MITVQQLTDLRLGKLKTAVSDWHEMVRKLRRLADGEGGDVSAAKLRARAEAANWKGDNATVGKSFVTKTASEFDDAVTEAESVHAVLRDVHAGMVKHKADLRDSLDDLAKRHIRIDRDGKAHASVPEHSGHKHALEGEKPSSDELDAAERRVKRILWEAHEDDRIAARALRRFARNRYDFSDHGVKSLKDADRQQGKADAEAWVKKIARGNVANWSHTDLARFNEVLKNQRDNTQFAETFATGVSAEGTLRLWRNISNSAPGEIAGQVQDSLSMTLATATHSNSSEMRMWKHDLLLAGSKPFPLDGYVRGPYGFQVMSSLMGKGNFDSNFLQHYGTRMLQFERGSQRDPQHLWYGMESLDHSQTDRSKDPLNGFMEALGHNPEASLDFFNGSTGHGDDKISNFDYLVGQGEDARDWMKTDHGKGDFASLGHALESAALGYPYDDENPSIPAMDTKEEIEDRKDRTAFVKQIMQNYKSVDQINAQPGVRDSLANIAASNVDSMSYTLATNWGATGVLTDRDALFNQNERHLRDFGKGVAADFLRAVCSDQSSYETVSAAQQIYGASFIAAQGDNQEAALDAGMYSVTMHGAMDEAREEAIGKEFADDEEAKNRALEKQGEWRKYAAGAVLGAAAGAGSALIVPVSAVGAVAVPLAFDSGAGVGETLYGNNTLDWLHDKEYSNDQEAVDKIQDLRTAGQRRAALPLLNYAEEHGIREGEARDKIESPGALAYDHGHNITDTDNVRGE